MPDAAPLSMQMLPPNSALTVFATTDRGTDYGSEGQGFKSSWARHTLGRARYSGMTVSRRGHVTCIVPDRSTTWLLPVDAGLRTAGGRGPCSPSTRVPAASGRLVPNLMRQEQARAGGDPSIGPPPHRRHRGTGGSATLPLRGRRRGSQISRRLRRAPWCYGRCLIESSGRVRLLISVPRIESSRPLTGLKSTWPCFSTVFSTGGCHFRSMADPCARGTPSHRPDQLLLLLRRFGLGPHPGGSLG